MGFRTIIGGPVRGCPEPLATEHEPRHQVEESEKHWHNIPGHGRDDVAVTARRRPRGRPGTKPLASCMPQIGSGTLRAATTQALDGSE